VYALAQRFGRATRLERAREVDPGFEQNVLAEMLRTLDRFLNEEIPVDVGQVPHVRAFFREWADEFGPAAVAPAHRPRPTVAAHGERSLTS
jgi:hypothetical protein